jgi:hypothetical protein
LRIARYHEVTPRVNRVMTARHARHPSPNGAGWRPVMFDTFPKVSGMSRSSPISPAGGLLCRPVRPRPLPPPSAPTGKTRPAARPSRSASRRRRLTFAPCHMRIPAPMIQAARRVRAPRRAFPAPSSPGPSGQKQLRAGSPEAPDRTRPGCALVQDRCRACEGDRFAEGAHNLESTAIAKGRLYGLQIHH